MKNIKYLYILLFSFICGPAMAKGPTPPIFTYTISPGNLKIGQEATITVTATVIKGQWIYTPLFLDNPTYIEFDPVDWFILVGDLKSLGVPEKHYDDLNKVYDLVFYDKAQFIQKIRITKNIS